MEFRINFRALRLEDAAFINDLRTMEAMEQLIGGVKRPVAPERDRKWVEDLILGDRQDLFYYAICEQGQTEIIGYTSISDIDFRNGTCFWSGIKLHPDHAGKGYGTQVALKILQIAFEELRVVRCAAECQEKHETVLKLFDRVGYVKEGLMRKKLYKNGLSNNIWLLSVTDEEYPGIKQKFGFQ